MISIRKIKSEIERAFRGLRSRDQELLSLFAWEGLSVSEIARILRKSEVAVSVQLSRAKSRFLEVLRRDKF